MDITINNNYIVLNSGSTSIKIEDKRRLESIRTQYQNWIKLSGSETYERTFDSEDAPKEIFVRSVGISPAVPIRIGYPAELVVNEDTPDEQIVQYTSWTPWGTNFALGGLNTTNNINTFIVEKSSSHPTANLEVLFVQ